ncbi:hypothetical protein C8T65DRAFT_258430 [Cerioporus squamosus]|nr:hypothetical protein C8T65DRAFT_258430 [Cerioporus squamosus]
MSSPNCVCGKSCKDEGGLLRHQAKCAAWAHRQRIGLAAWNQSNQIAGPVPKRRRLEGWKTATSSGGPSALPDEPQVPEPHVPYMDQTNVDFPEPPPPPLPRSPSPPPPRVTAQGRPIRSNRSQLPGRFMDFIPDGPSPLSPPDSPRLPPSPSHQRETLHSELSPGAGAAGADTSPPIEPVKRTPPNRFGLIREYTGPRPDVDPEDTVTLADLVDDSAVSLRVQQPSQRGILFAPYPNFSSFLFGKWYWRSGTKSEEDREVLVDTLFHPDFKLEDIRDVSWRKVDRELAGHATSKKDIVIPAADNWRHSDVTIKVPFGKDNLSVDYTVRGLAHRPLEEVVRSVCGSALSAGFHYSPYMLLWQPPRTREGLPPPLQQVYGEAYTSRAFRDADEELQRSPREPGCTLPRAVIALMPWSDSTHLAEYGNASLWPIYLQFGNQSKYERGRPSANACHHVAYIPKLPDNFQDLAHEHVTRADISELMTHCRRELMHGVWCVLLSDEFVRACRHGIIVMCYDGVLRRLYPRFFSYSADYPEKVLLATIRDMGNCPCPRCLVRKQDINAVGTPQDMETRVNNARHDDEERRQKVAAARNLIYEKGRGVGSKPVDELLKAQSLVPTVNAFSARVPQFVPDGNFHALFVPDLLHEWELGVWKNIMTHLIRILHAEKGNKVREFNSRFRKVPVFGRDTIRRFVNNLAEMKQIAARDFEDALQCFIPVYDRLLPEPHNTIVLDLLFLTAFLHGLHKLRMHVDTTLTITGVVFTRFTVALRKFKEVTCAAYHTTELPKEVRARARRQAASAISTSVSTAGAPAQPPQPPSAPAAAPRQKEFSMSTFKLHSLGDYVSSIQRTGTTDSDTTMIGEVAHRKSKHRYDRTSKKDYTSQLADIERREARNEEITQAVSVNVGSSVLGVAGEKPSTTAFLRDPTLLTSTSATPTPTPARTLDDVPDGEGEDIPLDVHHHVAKSQKGYEYIPHFVRRHLADPPARNFVALLKDHVLRRLDNNFDDDHVFSNQERAALLFEHDRMYSHQTLHVNYTTYDIRRGRDFFNVSSERCDIMVLSREEQPEGRVEDTDTAWEKYWYARIIGIYHVNVVDNRPGRSTPAPVRMEFLHVRWFGKDPEWSCGWAANRLDRIGFVPYLPDDPECGAFGFVDPSDVIRGCHLIPAFADGLTTAMLGPSSLAHKGKQEDDWERYYVGR